MGLTKLTDNICFLPHEPERDRPMLAYVQGEKYSLAIDAGYSASHVKDFYEALIANNFGEPDFTVITHWHYDHTFGLHAVKGVSIAHKKTNLFLKEQQDKARDKTYIDLLKKDDIHFAKEYAQRNELNIVMSDLEFVGDITLNSIGHLDSTAEQN
ncbi:MBL fold metallo-hydrolase [Clostridium sp. AM58-1XD]|uniref:MBL fold metallo-hydrolase n=1 Tax=Clostridium sp. AM58-1XD TaxID=2292307 RepID=UPI000E4D83A3|nr:MBL fold metallo-hydrolase [Clostridium sp. AM58-1XD]RGY95689.1 MBL fold metallo-hydrolase [Clostridium sp. AM58-1XD]